MGPLRPRDGRVRFVNEVPADIGEDAISYRRDRLEDDVVTYVTEHDGELPGYASVEYREPPPVFRRGPEANVEELYVRPTHRGKQVASQLLRIEEWGRERDRERVILSVNAANDPAQRLYGESGYETRRHKTEKPL